jgi:hypothetical protein
VIPVALWADYAGLRKNLRRLAQVAALAARRWEEHEQACTMCRLELDTEDGAEYVCAEGVALYMAATAYRCAVDTIKGAMTWE